MKLTKQQARKRKRYYTVYKIYSDLDDKVYIGQHRLNKWKSENDGYICSSSLVLALIRRNGKEHYKKKILGRYSTIREANAAEKFYIQKFDSFKNGLNRSKDGGPMLASGRFKRRRTCQSTKK